MNVLFFFTAHPRLEMIFKIQSEILMKHVLNGDNIYLVADFEGDIFRSQVNYNSVKSNKYFFKSMFQNMLTYMRSKGASVTLLNYREADFRVTKLFNDVPELKGYNYKGYSLGVPVASSLISMLRDHSFDTKKYRKRVEREFVNALRVLSSVEYYHQDISPEITYVFNGRMSVYAPVVLYCQKQKVEHKVFEFALSFDKYHLLNNTIPHNMDYRHKEIVDLWEDKSVSFEEKKKIGTTFFEHQKSGVATVDQSYIGLQNKELEPSELEGKKVITFFNSSIDEFAAVPGWENYVYLFKDEVEAIFQICKRYENDPTKKFILRVHPNLKFLDNTQNRDLKKLSVFKNLLIIEPHSPIKSYFLLEKSDVIITFGSTIGVEACYYGKPVICLGLSYYKNLDVAYIPTTKEELYQYLDTSSLTPKLKENTLAYGYWFRSFGTPFIHFANGYISEKDYQLTKKQRRIGLSKKITDAGTYKRVLRVLNPKKNILKKIKDPTYRRSLFREFTPWRIK